MIFYVFDVSFDMTNIKTHSQKDSYGHAFNYEIGLIPKIDYHLHTWYRFHYSYEFELSTKIYMYLHNDKICAIWFFVIDIFCYFINNLCIMNTTSCVYQYYYTVW